VEVLIAGTIGTVIMGAVITTYLVSVRGFTAISNYSEIHADGRRAVDIFSRDMRTLYQITSYGPSNLVCRLPTGFSSSGAVTSYKTITYSINKGALYRSDSSTGKTSMLATNIYQLNFKLYDRIGSNTTVIGTAKGIQLDIKLRKRVVSQIQSEDYLSARLDMRNKP
jgi:hypothetical protein